jgi:hypothetical protein
MIARHLLIASLAAILCTSPARASESIDLLRLNPFTDLGASLAHGFTGWNGALQLSAVMASTTLVLTGADTRVHNTLVRNDGLAPYTVPAVYAGFFLPVTLGAAAAIYGYAAEAPREYAAACAVLQSLMIVGAETAVLKAVTGRRPPEAVTYDGQQRSRSFRFGLLRGGIDWGWPSGMLTSNTAAVVSLAHMYPESTALRIGGGAYLGVLAFSQLAHESSAMAWLSDVVAGLLFGYAVGDGVGETFAGKGAADGLLSNLSLTPMSGDRHGLVATLAL